MIPMLYGEVHSMARSIASRFLKKQILDDVTNGQKLLEIDFKASQNQVPLKSIDIGFGAKSQLKFLTETEKISFFKGCKAFLLYLFEKIAVSSKSPLSKKLVKGLSCLLPPVMLKENLRKERINLALKVLINKKHLPALEGDVIKKEYVEICERPSLQLKLKNFNPKKDRLDQFFVENLEEGDSHFFSFVKKVLCLFHGNAEVERGFSVNKECLLENLQEHSLIAQRWIYSSVLLAGGISNIEITKGMLHSVSLASRRRREVLKENEMKKTKTKDTVKKVSEDIRLLEEKKRKHQEQSDAELNLILSELDVAKKRLKLCS